MKHIKLFEQFINESSMSIEDHKKIKNFLNDHRSEIETQLGKSSEHIYWNVEVLPEYDNIIGGYNLQAIAVDVVDRNHVLDNSQIKDAIYDIKKLPFVSKVKVSPKYNKTYVSCIAIGLKPNYL